MRKDKDHKCKGENTIGKIIYGFLLFLPLLAILITCLVAILNKNVEVTYTDVFYQAITTTEESALFDWATDSAIYTGINATSQALSIDNTFIPMLLTYWLIISVFYFLYDIILMMLNVLHKKIHELQDSI